jgi:hypothetical protein
MFEYLMLVVMFQSLGGGTTSKHEMVVEFPTLESCVEATRIVTMDPELALEARVHSEEPGRARGGVR